MSQDFVFTVFTPTYNRAHTLPKLFSSLQEQTFEDFEWVIVDDGSTDNTEDVVQQWQDDSDFPIRYFRQENSGKPAATNRGVRQAAGELFLDIDSDDHLLPEALEILFEHWQKIPDQDKSHFAGVGGLCAYESGEIVGTPYPESPLDSEPVEIYYQLGVKGDKKWFVRTDLRRQFLYPRFEDEKHVPPSVVWNRIGKKYLFRFVNEIVVIKHYRSGGITNSWLDTMTASPRGYRLQIQELLEREKDVSVPFLRRVSHWGQYWRFSLHANAGLSGIVRDAPSPSTLFLPTAPIGLYRYIVDKIRGG